MGIFVGIGVIVCEGLGVLVLVGVEVGVEVAVDVDVLVFVEVDVNVYVGGEILVKVYSWVDVGITDNFCLVLQLKNIKLRIITNIDKLSFLKNSPRDVFLILTGSLVLANLKRDHSGWPTIKS